MDTSVLSNIYPGKYRRKYLTESYFRKNRMFYITDSTFVALWCWSTKQRRSIYHQFSSSFPNSWYNFLFVKKKVLYKFLLPNFTIPVYDHATIRKRILAGLKIDNKWLGVQCLKVLYQLILNLLNLFGWTKCNLLIIRTTKINL